ncbi:SMI1/KNR4 family protein [Microlunatus soli]|uniref:SMI1-KNR4 cell-wall n=1 Tax=Microlunatus soli TaxID=630515 RepID=A0A1H1XCR4_9ACTN|nr:SMI1/KNR4 family protein [Microlunatus soli]SDT07067.1 SMI1-KNR4 cell-wall [Microlunatus soli]
MTAVEAAESLIQLVHEYSRVSTFADGCSDEMLRAAEQQLGVVFPPSYRRVVQEFGTWDIAGLEFLGVYQTPAMGNELLGSVRATRDARASLGLPASMIEVMEDDLGLVVLDTAALDEDGEAARRQFRGLRTRCV